MITRHWRALARPERAHEYVVHLQKKTFPQLRKLPGFIDASILRRDQPRGVEFLVLTHWRSAEDIRAFVDAHRPLPDATRLADAPFWNEAQARFLRDEIREDADWAPVVDQLNLMLHA